MMTDNTSSKKAKWKILIDSFLVFLIAITPFLYKLYDYLPENPEATISILGITIDNNGFPDVSTYAWFMLSKIIPLYLLVLWFLTAKDWWYHILIIPIAMYAFQIFEVLYSYDKEIDTENIWWLLPVCMIVIPFVYFIRIKLYDKYVHGIDLEAMEAELEAIKHKDDFPKPVLEVVGDDVPSSATDQSSGTDSVKAQLPHQKVGEIFRSMQQSLHKWRSYKS